jgi:uncharacterized DUF497 family protein
LIGNGLRVDEEKRTPTSSSTESTSAKCPMFDGPTVEAIDDRFNYGETRTNCLGEIEGRVSVVTITWRGADRRIISARKANAREQRT